MKKLLIALLLTAGSLQAQPYLDLLQLSYHNGPGTNPSKFKHIRMQANIPLVLKDSSVILVNPLWEERWAQVNEKSDIYHVRALATWFTYTKPLGKKWSAMAAFVPRFIGEPEIQFKEGFQAGAAFLLNYRRNATLTWKFGAYYNDEFFGLFLIPLIGIDWKISSRQRLFGVAPGYLTYENRLNKTLSWGGNFRTFTSSYKTAASAAGNDNYIRFDDNQIGAYLDIYAAKKLVINLEMGYSVVRRIRSGTGKMTEETFLLDDHGPYARICLQYRLRLDK